DVKILTLQGLGAPVLDPRGPRERLTLGTVPIRAGVIRDALMATGVALFHMPTEYSSAARLDRGHDPPMGGRRRYAGLLPIGVAVAAEDIRHFECRAIHGTRRSEVLRGRRRGRGCDGAREPIKGTPRRTHRDRGNAEVARGGRQTAMAEEQLNGADVSAGFKEV